MFKLNLHLLNPQQRQAVEHVDGPMLLLAGAGSGKTRVITHRVGNLISKGIAPQNILAVSFTNKAANEMGERVASLVGPKIAAQVHMSTFHALGVDILKRHIHKLGYRRPYTILDQGDQLAIVKDLLKDRNLDPKKVDPKSILSMFSSAKMEFSRPGELESLRNNPFVVEADGMFDEYQSALVGFNAVDFDDLICLPMRLLQEDDKLRVRYNNLFRYVMVDEYQDTNRTQLMLIELLVRDHHNIVVVGDDDQSIYGFRGAVAGNILEFEDNFPGTKIIKLEQNYRSSNTIIQAANAVISNNTVRKSKTLWSAKEDGPPIHIVECADAREEAEFVAAEIEHYRQTYDLNYSDFAILYRVNPQSVLFEEALRCNDIPYNLIGGTEFFERREVKDFIAYIKACMNPSDEVALRRIVNVPPRGIGATTMETLSTIAHENRWTFFETLEAIAACEISVEGIGPKGRNKIEELVHTLMSYRHKFEHSKQPLSEIAAELREEINLNDYIRSQERSYRIASRRVANLDFVLGSIERFESRSGHNIDGFLTRITLDRASMGEKEMVDGVWLMTLHSSKGLEFPVVFLVGVEENYLPHERSMTSPKELAEERRLAYVGITRAKEKLYMTYALERSRYGTSFDRTPSRFLSELPKERLHVTNAQVSEEYAEMKKERTQNYIDMVKKMLSE